MTGCAIMATPRKPDLFPQMRSIFLLHGGTQ
jgi:hypothetical protein